MMNEKLEGMDFKGLRSTFTEYVSDFEDFEKVHRKKLPREREQFEDTLSKFGFHLSKLADLQFAFVQIEVRHDEKVFREQHIDAINVVINKIQFLYMLPLSQELSRKYNKFNFEVAVASIIIGAMIPYIISFAQDLCKPNKSPLAKEKPAAEAKFHTESANKSDSTILYRSK